MKKQMLFLVLLFSVVLLIPVGTQRTNVSVGNAEDQHDLAIACESDPSEVPITYYDDTITIKLMYEEETIILAWEDWTEDGEGEFLPNLEGLERIEFIYAWGKAGFDFIKGYTFFSPEPDGPDLVKLTYIVNSEIDGESYTSHILFFEANPHDIEVDYMRWYGGEPYSPGLHTNMWLWFDEADSSVQVAFHSGEDPFEFQFQGIYGDPVTIEDIAYPETKEYVLDLHPWGADIYSAAGWMDDIELEDHLGAFFFEPYMYHAPIEINLETWDNIIEEFDGRGTRWNPLKIRGLCFENIGEVQSAGIYIESYEVEDVYIDIRDCLFIGFNEGILSDPISGRIRIMDSLFIGNRFGVYFMGYAEQNVEDCLFYGGLAGEFDAGVYLEETFDVTVKDSTFYAVENGIFTEGLTENSRTKIDGCNIYSCISGVYIKGSDLGEDGAIVISDNHIDYCSQGIKIRKWSQRVIVKDNEFSHCTNPILIDNEASFNIITGNYIHDCGDETGIGIYGHHNIIKSNKFDDSNFEIGIFCYPASYENEFTWNLFLETSFSSYLVADTGEGNLWDFNYYSDYEGDGKEPYIIGWPELEIQDLHPLGPEVPYIPPPPPDRTDYTYHASIWINAETWDDVIEEFDGMGTQDSPLKIRGFYFEDTGYGQSDAIIINTDVEDAYIDIEDCLFIGYHSYSFTGVLSYPSSGRIRIKDSVFIDNKYGVYLSEHAEQIVEDCLFYGGSVVGQLGAGVFLEEAYDVTVEDCNFYAVERGILAEWLSPTSRFEIHSCNIYSGTWGIDIHGSDPGEDGAIVIMDNHIDYCSLGIYILQNSQRVIVNDNEFTHCRNPIFIDNEASFNTIIGNYIHDCGDDAGMLIAGHHNIIKSNRFEDSNFEIAIYCYLSSYENEFTWNVFIETSLSSDLVADSGEGNLWDFNYYSDYEGDGTEPYIIGWPELEIRDLHPLGPEVPYIPPTPPNRADYTYHASIWINAETWDDVIEEFDGMGTQDSPLKIRGFYFEGQSRGVFINTDVEDAYIDIEDCLFIGYHSYSFIGILSYPSSGRIRIKDCVFIDNEQGVYLSEHAEQTVEDCMFYGGSSPYGSAVFLEDAYDVAVKDCTFYAVERGVFGDTPPSSHLEINRCDIYGITQYGIQLVGGMERIHLGISRSNIYNSYYGIHLEYSYVESSYVGISRCNFYNTYYGIYAVNVEVEDSLIEIDECSIYDGIYGIYFDGVKTGPNGEVLIHDSEISRFDELPQSTAVYLTGGCVGIVIDNNYIHDCESGINLRQNESYNCISRNKIEYCSRAININPEGLSYVYEARGNIISDNNIAHISLEAIWFHRYTTENIFTGNYLHDNEIGDAEQYNMFIQGHHNIIKLNKFENLGSGLVAITLYWDIWAPFPLQNEIKWNVFLDTDVTAISDWGGDNIIEYNYYSDYEGDGTEPYKIHSLPGYPEIQDLHPLGPELTFYFWWDLLCQYPSEVFQMWRWLI